MRWIAILLTGAMVALRIRTVGWFLVMLWPLYLVWAGVHLIIVLRHLRLVVRVPSKAKISPIVLFWLSQGLYFTAMVVQVDFGDTPDSVHIALIGNNAISRAVQEHWSHWFTLAGMGLAVVYGLQLIQITRRERGSGKGARSA